MAEFREEREYLGEDVGEMCLEQMEVNRWHDTTRMNASQDSDATGMLFRALVVSLMKYVRSSSVRWGTCNYKVSRKISEITS